MQSPGWKVYLEKLTSLQMEAQDVAMEAENEIEFMHRKGFWMGISQVLEFQPHLIPMSEETKRGDYIENWVNKQAQEFLPPEGVSILDSVR